MSRYTDLIANPYARRRYCVELHAFDPGAGAVVPRYFSDDGFVSRPTDGPANTWFEPRVKTALSFTRSLWAEGRLGGRSVPGAGQLELANADGGLDYLAGWAVDGRRVVVKLGGDGFAYGDFGVVYEGTAETLEWGESTVTIRLRDLQYRVDKPLLTTRLGGTGGWDGTADHKGRVLPWPLGKVRHVEPVCVDPALYRYRVSWRAVQAIDAIRDAGVALTIAADYASLAALDAAAIPAGQAATCLAQGAFRLASPPAGIITCDLRGDNVGGYVASVAQLIKRVAMTAGGLTAPEIKDASVTALDVLNASVVGHYATDESERVGEVLDRLADAIGAWWGFDRAGLLDMGRLDAPTGVPVADYTDREILSFERLATKLPIWRLVLGYQRNWRPMAQSDLAAVLRPGGASAAAGAWYLQEWRLTDPGSDAAVQARHLLAGDERHDTLLDDAAAAVAERDRRFAMLKADRDMYRIRVKTQPFALDLGQVVQIATGRYGLAAGKPMVIVSLTEDSAANQVEMEVWG